MTCWSSLEVKSLQNSYLHYLRVTVYIVGIKVLEKAINYLYYSEPSLGINRLFTSSLEKSLGITRLCILVFGTSLGVHFGFTL